MTEGNQTQKQILESLSQQDFLAIGAEHIAYIRPVKLENKTAYALRSADGKLVSVQDTKILAAAFARRNSLDLVALQ